jgi:hypothetical protein
MIADPLGFLFSSLFFSLKVKSIIARVYGIYTHSPKGMRI